MKAERRITINVWSDIVCPFCYIGKRKLEHALGGFPAGDRVDVVWRSFQLQPDTRTDPTRNSIRSLVERKGWSMEAARQAAVDVANRARTVGLELDFEGTKVANTFDAHRLTHYAASLGKGDAIQERLFRAYFVEGRNVGDFQTLVELAVDIGLPELAARDALATGRFAEDVRRDIDEALQLGINGVPFFVFDRRYAVSGAQDGEVFLEALRRTLST